MRCWWVGGWGGHGGGQKRGYGVVVGKVRGRGERVKGRLRILVNLTKARSVLQPQFLSRKEKLWKRPENMFYQQHSTYIDVFHYVTFLFYKHIARPAEF